jgi:hypothetical protein
MAKKQSGYQGHRSEFNPPSKVAHVRKSFVSGDGGFGACGSRTNANDGIAKRPPNASMPSNTKSPGVNGVDYYSRCKKG